MTKIWILRGDCPWPPVPDRAPGSRLGSPDGIRIIHVAAGRSLMRLGDYDRMARVLVDLGRFRGWALIRFVREPWFH